MIPISTRFLFHFSDFGSGFTTPFIELTSDEGMILRSRSYHPSKSIYQHTFTPLQSQTYPLPHLKPTTKLYHIHQNIWLTSQRREQNGYMEEAQLISTQDDRITTLEVGHFFNHIQSSPNGNIWFGYSEDGASRRSSHLSSAVIACMNLQGDVVYRLDKDPHLPESKLLVDCYTLNVLSDQEVWACYYPGGVIQIVDGTIKQLWTDLPSIDRIAVGKEFILYETSRHTVERTAHRLFLTSRAYPKLAQAVSPFYQNRPLRYSQTVAKGSCMYFVTDEGVYVTNLNETLFQ